MAADYKFYIQDFATRTLHDIEADFRCRYCEFKGLLDREVKNVYSEDYAEADGARTYIPPTPRFKPYDCTLRLLFLSETAQADSLEFASFVQGRKVEYHDTFRNLYFTLVCTKPPQTGNERLYGGVKYREMTYTFTNITGKFYDRAQIR